jgi:hypothetical protein
MTLDSARRPAEGDLLPILAADYQSDAAVITRHLDILALSKVLERAIGVDRRTTVAFAHQRIQEYFATCLLMGQPGRVPARQLLEQERWREIAVSLCQIGSNSDPSIIGLQTTARAVLTQELQTALALPEGVPFSGRLVPLVRQYRWSNKTLGVLDVMARGYQSHPADLDPELRAMAGYLAESAISGSSNKQARALAVAPIVPNRVAKGAVEHAFRSSDPRLRRAALRQLDVLPNVSTALAKDVREFLVDELMSGNRDSSSLLAYSPSNNDEGHDSLRKAALSLRRVPLVDLLLIGSILAVWIILRLAIGIGPDWVVDCLVAIIGLGTAITLPVVVAKTRLSPRWVPFIVLVTLALRAFLVIVLVVILIQSIASLTDANSRQVLLLGVWIVSLYCLSWSVATAMAIYFGSERAGMILPQYSLVWFMVGRLGPYAGSFAARWRRVILAFVGLVILALAVYAVSSTPQKHIWGFSDDAQSIGRTLLSTYIVLSIIWLCMMGEVMPLLDDRRRLRRLTPEQVRHLGGAEFLQVIYSLRGGRGARRFIKMVGEQAEHLDKLASLEPAVASLADLLQYMSVVGRTPKKKRHKRVIPIAWTQMPDPDEEFKEWAERYDTRHPGQLEWLGKKYQTETAEISDLLARRILRDSDLVIRN